MSDTRWQRPRRDRCPDYRRALRLEPIPDRQRDRLTSGDVPVAVYGLGKMGLPLAAVYAETTGNVTGVDIDPTVIETITDGESHVVGEPGLADLVADQVDAGRLEATTDGSTAASAARITSLSSRRCWTTRTIRI